LVKAAVEGEFEWLLLYEHDVIPPADTFVRLNDYIRQAEIPVISGLYFTRSIPSEPLVYRGRGVSYYDKWKLGDKVWADGVPTGMLLVHVGILREMWQDAEEYQVGNQMTRRVFDAPRKMWFDPEKHEYYSLAGTSDLDWCKQVIDGDYMRKAGWGDFVDSLEDERWPFLVDTAIFCRHINPDGQQFPSDAEIAQWEFKKPEPERPPLDLAVRVSEKIEAADKVGG
jgi:hypothetical protein